MGLKSLLPRFLKPTIHFIHVIEPRNQGDMLCYPYLYFKKYFKRYNCKIHSTKNIDFGSISTRDTVVLASGGCFECLDSFQDAINTLLDINDCVIGWGCGHNAHHDRPVYWHIDFSKFKLLGVRDYNYPRQAYVPCVSAMHPLLETRREIIRKIGVIEHQDFPITEFSFDKTNHCQSMYDICRFIAESEVIITNTYHSAYWAQLMNKKVILYKPWSTKFDHFRHPPVVYSGNLEKDMEQAKNYPGFLKESRDINRAFFKKVKRIIERYKI